MLGIFDSGSGGLTVLRAIRDALPTADIIYFGDIKHAPYGSRSRDELSRLTQGGVEFLKSRGATKLVSACNSVSASVLAGAAGDLPYIEMSRPLEPFLRAHAGKKFLLIATPATIDSKLYDLAVGSVVTLDSLAVSELAGAIEFGEIEETIKNIVRAALLQEQGKRYDGLILGCTHYPLVRDSIETTARELFGARIMIVDPADAVAREVMTRFNTPGDGTLAFYISQDSPVFRRLVGELFAGVNYSIEIV